MLGKLVYSVEIGEEINRFYDRILLVDVLKKIIVEFKMIKI